VLIYFGYPQAHEDDATIVSSQTGAFMRAPKQPVPRSSWRSKIRILYSCRDPDGHLWNFGTYDPWA
jgi:uncharacterized glyoxalase superfamily protein PhnB